MKKVEYKTEINAKREKVWNTMLQRETYLEWTSEAWPGASFTGSWKQGEDMRFTGGGENAGGTMANVEEVRKPEYLRLNHVAVINGDGSLDRTSDIAKGWIGTLEEYFFTEKNGKTELKVILTISPEWEKEFAESWPKALAKLKAMCEGKTVTA